MKDVTDLILNYREAVRHLWSAYVLPFDDDEMPWLLIPINYYLRYSLIVWPLGRDSDQQAVSGDFRYGKGFEMNAVEHADSSLPYLRIIPNLDPYPQGIPVIWFHHDRHQDKSIYEHDVLTTMIDIRFTGLESEATDFRNCYGRVYEYPHDPTKVGINIKFDVLYARFLFDEDHNDRMLYDVADGI